MNFADSFRAARWIRLVNLFLQALLFLSLIGGLNYVALQHAWRFDLTRTRQHSLSAETLSYLEGLKRDVNVIVTIIDDGENEELAQAYRDISGLLREYVYRTRNGPKTISVEYVNIYQSRKRAEELKVYEDNQVVLTCDGNRRVLKLGDFYRTKDRRREAFQGESALTAAILDVSGQEKKKVYFLTGHGEMRPDDTERTRGLSQLRDELRQRNFEIASLDLSLTSNIPADASRGIIIIASPLKPLQPFEEERLRNFLQTRAGRIILMLDPGKQHGLENLLFDWGVIVYDNVIIDLDPGSLTETGDLRLWHFSRDPVSHITDNLINNELPVLVGSARVVSDDLGAGDGLSVKKLIATSAKAWGEANYSRQDVPAEYTPGQDLHGELGVMVISERVKPANLPLSVRGGRLAVFGTADLVTNNRIFTTGNLNLFLATVNWTVDRDTQLNILARPIQRLQLALSQEELTRLRLGLLLIVPGVVALLGFIVYWTRRN